MGKKNKSRDGKINPNEIFKTETQAGIGEIIRQHPRFKNIGNYIAKHIDHRLVEKRMKSIYAYAIKEKKPREEIEEYLTNGVADYISSGAAFDRVGKEVILKKGLEEKANSGLFKGFFARRELNGEKYLDKSLDAFNEVYEMFKSGDYDMPEVEGQLKYLNRLGFAGSAADILKDAGLIGGSQYSKIKGNIRKGAKEATREFGSRLEKYAQYKVASSIFGIFGVGLIIASKIGITGNVVGNQISNNPSIIAGAVLLVLALGLFLGRKEI